MDTFVPIIYNTATVKDTTNQQIWYELSFLGAFSKLRKTTISFEHVSLSLRMSVHISTRNKSAPTGGAIKIFDI